MRKATAMEDPKTKDVETLLGDPKKAIVAMAIPIAIAMIAQSANNLIDAVWVVRLGSDAMAAVGVVFPLFFIIIGICNGIGIGAASAITKRVGQDNKADADNATTHALVLMIIASLILTPLMLLILRPLLMVMGGADIIDDCYDYAMPLCAGMFIFMISSVMSSVLRAEGAAKRSMVALIIPALINMAIAPIFIYDDLLGFGFGWGLTGAAIAILISSAIGMFMTFYWYFAKRDTFLKFRFKGFKHDPVITKDILRVGLPAAMEMMILSLVSIVMNLILIQAAGTDAVAVYSSDWRLIQMLMIPIMGISAAVVPVCAAAYGAKRFDKIKEAYLYSLKISISFMVLLSIITAIFASQMLTVFTYDESTAHLKGDMLDFLRISCIFMPFMAFGIVSASLFQSMGMGVRSLISTVFRNALMLPICFLLIDHGLKAIWWGVAFAEIAGPLLVGIWGLLTVRFLIRQYNNVVGTGSV